MSCRCVNQGSHGPEVQVQAGGGTIPRPGRLEAHAALASASSLRAGPALPHEQPEVFLHTTINPRRFLGKEVTLSPLARGQSAVLLDGLRIGRVSHVPDPEKREVWLWTLTGPYCDSLAANVPVLGEATTLTEAKTKLRASFDIWLRSALEKDEAVRWHWLEAGPSSPRIPELRGKPAAA